MWQGALYMSESNPHHFSLPAREVFALPPTLTPLTTGVQLGIPIAGNEIQLQIVPFSDDGMPPAPEGFVAGNWLIGSLMLLHSPQIPPYWDNTTLWLPRAHFVGEGQPRIMALVCTTRPGTKLTDPTGRRWAADYLTALALPKGTHAAVFVKSTCLVFSAQHAPEDTTSR